MPTNLPRLSSNPAAPAQTESVEEEGASQACRELAEALQGAGACLQAAIKFESAGHFRQRATLEILAKIEDQHTRAVTAFNQLRELLESPKGHCG